MDFALEKIMEISQEGTVREYCDSFQILLNQVKNREDLSEDSMVYFFIAGLKPEISEVLKPHHNIDRSLKLKVAIFRAEMQEINLKLDSMKREQDQTTILGGFRAHDSSQFTKVGNAPEVFDEMLSVTENEIQEIVVAMVLEETIVGEVLESPNDSMVMDYLPDEREGDVSIFRDSKLEQSTIEKLVQMNLWKDVLFGNNEIQEPIEETTLKTVKNNKTSNKKRRDMPPFPVTLQFVPNDFKEIITPLKVAASIAGSNEIGFYPVNIAVITWTVNKNLLKRKVRVYMWPKWKSKYPDTNVVLEMHPTPHLMN